MCLCGAGNLIGDDAKANIKQLVERNEAQHRSRSEGGLGVKVTYIVAEFKDEACAAAQQAAADPIKYEIHPDFPVNVDDPNFHQIKAVLAYGEQAKGYGIVCPRDGQPNCAIVDALFKQRKAMPASHFLSWVSCKCVEPGGVLTTQLVIGVELLSWYLCRINHCLGGASGAG